MTLVNILVKVFHNRDGAADFNIDVALVPHGQVRVVRDDPTVVKDKARAARGREQQQEVVRCGVNKICTQQPMSPFQNLMRLVFRCLT